jgi:uncharacterized protein with PhoU and TrkA domain
MSQYVQFKPCQNELNRLLELMTDLASSEYLFNDKVLKTEVGNS